STPLFDLNGLLNSLRSWARLRPRHSSSVSASYQVIIADTRSAWSRLQTYEVIREGIATRLTISVPGRVGNVTAVRIGGRDPRFSLRWIETAAPAKPPRPLGRHRERCLRRRVLESRAPDDLVRLVLGTADQELLEVPLLLLPGDLPHVRAVVVGGIGSLRTTERGAVQRCEHTACRNHGNSCAGRCGYAERHGDPPPGRQRDRPGHRLERGRSQRRRREAGRRLELPAALAAVEVRPQPDRLELGQLAVELRRDCLAHPFTVEKTCSHR